MIINKIFNIISIVFLSVIPMCSEAQLDSAMLASKIEYTSLSEALKDPLNVYKLNLRKKKLKTFPTEIFQLINLQELNLSKNKITEIPEEIGLCTKLEVLDFSRNKLVAIPSQIGKLIRLKKLIIPMNEISTLPPEISSLIRLQVLDMWGNEIAEFPDEISKLQRNLRILDLRVIAISQDMQNKIIQQLPFTTIYFSKSCNCR